mmetsp:Transcript_16571/g.28235  ORF Transcript_16571/g.28235 Transcript_16571/m.28235 type:complete len:216 (-) Transcript_16571:322-969(-)
MILGVWISAKPSLYSASRNSWHTADCTRMMALLEGTLRSNQRWFSRSSWPRRGKGRSVDWDASTSSSGLAASSSRNGRAPALDTTYTRSTTSSTSLLEHDFTSAGTTLPSTSTTLSKGSAPSHLSSRPEAAAASSETPPTPPPLSPGVALSLNFTACSVEKAPCRSTRNAEEPFCRTFCTRPRTHTFPSSPVAVGRRSSMALNARPVLPWLMMVA